MCCECKQFILFNNEWSGTKLSGSGYIKVRGFESWRNCALDQVAFWKSRVEKSEHD